MVNVSYNLISHIDYCGLFTLLTLSHLRNNWALWGNSRDMHAKFYENRLMHSNVIVRHTANRKIDRPNGRVKSKDSLRSFKKRRSNLHCFCWYLKSNRQCGLSKRLEILKSLVIKHSDRRSEPEYLQEPDSYDWSWNCKADAKLRKGVRQWCNLSALIFTIYARFNKKFTQFLFCLLYTSRCV